MYSALFVFLTFQTYACSPSDQDIVAKETETPNDTTLNQKDMKLKITVGHKILTATMHDNMTTQAFMEMLPFTIKMADLHNNEKYCHLPNKLPGKAIKPGTIQAGDLMLWDADYKCLVLFYKTFASPYSYVKLGTVDNLDELEDILGTGDIEAKFELL